MKTKLLSLSAVLAFALSAAGAIKPTGVSVSQDPVTHRVTVNYTLSEAAIVTFDVKENGTSIGGANLTHAYGDVHRLMAAGSHTFWWHPEKAWPGHRFSESSVSLEVVAWPESSPPDYCVVDLVVDKGGRTYYTAPEQLPGEGGITNKMYKTDYLVFRLVPAKDAIFPMGYRWGAQDSCLYHRVKLTNDFYMAVYEMTLGQCKNAIGEEPQYLASYYCTSYFNGTEFAGYTNNLANPMPQTPYFRFRGYGTGSTWGGSFTHEIADTGSFLYKMRNALGLPSLDLPTDAEWEFACRAGTAATRYDGSTDWPDDIAWTRNNSYSHAFGDWKGTWYMAHEVGLLAPNAFGLYDMIGNVKELCLDLYNEGTAYTGGATIDDPEAEPIVAPGGPATDIAGNYDGCSCGSYGGYTQAGLWGGDTTSSRRVARGQSVSDDNWDIWSHTRKPIGSSKCHTAYADYENDVRGPYGYRVVFVP